MSAIEEIVDNIKTIGERSAFIFTTVQHMGLTRLLQIPGRFWSRLLINLVLRNLLQILLTALVAV
jgi:hypothetical protein